MAARAELPGERAIAHTGGCHCGRVRFEVIAPTKIQVLECNCSICTKAGYLHLVVPTDRFKLLSGSEVLTSYGFNTHTAKHLFCSVCGIKSFYVPRADPGSRSVNVRCLDAGTVEEMSIVQYDGRHWGRRRRSRGSRQDISTRGVYRAVPGAAPIGKRHLLVTLRWHMLRAEYDLPGGWRQSCRRPVQRDQCRLRRFMSDRGGIVGKEAVTT